MNEADSFLHSGALTFDPVIHGVAQGLSQLFPPVEHPSGLVADEAGLQDVEGTDASS